MSDFPRLEIIHEHEFEEQLAALIPDAEEADDFTAAAEDLLSRDPRSGFVASLKLGIWILPMFPIRGRQVTLRGTLFSSHTGHHHAPLLLTPVKPTRVGTAK